MKEEFLSGFSKENLSTLLQTGIVRAGEGNRIASDYVILHSFDTYVVVEKPIEYFQGKVFSSQTYLDAVTFEAAERLLVENRVEKFLEVCCGSGFLSLAATSIADKVYGVDLDWNAVLVAEFNVRLNARQDAVQILNGDLFTPTRHLAPFQKMFLHPPCRIIPPGINYPNPIARIGSGHHGLDFVRRYLTSLDQYLDTNGEALFAQDLPEKENRILFVEELKEFSRKFDWHIEVLRIKTSTIEEIAETTTEKGLAMNPGFDFKGLYERIHEYYKATGISHLTYCWVSVKKDGRRCVIVN